MNSSNVYTNDAEEVCSVYAFECTEFEEQYYTNNAASDADEVRSVYAFDMTSYEEVEEQYHGNNAASDADEVRSVYAFESTSYGAEETTKADETLYRQDLTSFNLFNLYPPVGYKTVEHRNTDADIDDDVVESDDDDAFEKESVYAYEKPNATCPNDYHEHEGCFCGKPADYDLCDVEEAGDDEENESNPDGNDVEQCNADVKSDANEKTDPEAVDGNNAAVKNRNNAVKPGVMSDQTFFFVMSLFLSVISFWSQHWYMGVAASFAFFILAIVESPSNARRYFNATIENVVTLIASLREFYYCCHIFTTQIENHGTNFYYKLVTKKLTIEFVDEKRTVITDKSGASITILYNNGKSVFTSPVGMPSSKVASMLVGAQYVIETVWPK